MGVIGPCDTQVDAAYFTSCDDRTFRGISSTTYNHGQVVGVGAYITLSGLPCQSNIVCLGFWRQ